MSDEPIEHLDVVAVGAHPDDVEIGCGGTLASLARQGYRVGIIDLTDGEPTPGSPGPHVRWREAQAAAQCLGVDVRICLELTNRRLFDTQEARLALARELRRHRPRLVLALAGKTPLASPDHWQTGQIVDAALYLSGKTGYDASLDASHPPHTVEALLYYTLIFGAAGHPDLGTDIYVDVSETLDAKVAAVRCYATQFPPAKQYVFDRIQSMAIERGISAGVGAAERLVSPRPLVTTNLIETIMA